MGLVLSNKDWIIEAGRFAPLMCVWLQVILLVLGLWLYRYGMGPVNHRHGQNKLRLWRRT
jgi:hypothetical protein